jgi:hypothetical protein
MRWNIVPTERGCYIVGDGKPRDAWTVGWTRAQCRAAVEEYARGAGRMALRVISLAMCVEVVRPLVEVEGKWEGEGKGGTGGGGCTVDEMVAAWDRFWGSHLPVAPDEASWPVVVDLLVQHVETGVQPGPALV